MLETVEELTGYLGKLYIPHNDMIATRWRLTHNTLMPTGCALPPAMMKEAQASLLRDNHGEPILNEVGDYLVSTPVDTTADITFVHPGLNLNLLLSVYPVNSP